MAPVAPSKRPSLRAKAAAARKPAAGSGSQAPAAATTSSSSAAAAADALSSHTKRDRRATKHASFVSRIEKSRAAGSSKALKRRRPGNKLVANLDSLADALPDVAAAAAAASSGNGSGKVKHRSLRSRPGALKRKEKVVRGEVQRFGASLARLNALGEQARSGAAAEQQQQQQQQQQTPAEAQQTASAGPANNTAGAAASSSSASTSNRWAALRGFISATMEQNPAFVEK